MIKKPNLTTSLLPNMTKRFLVSTNLITKIINIHTFALNYI
ncbi:hypothetical protein SPSINT_1056 [Staphylococcus pseudintermedius HKU10-03]|nr:hypothetical protein SPSINT_1056 [Staphylococcus pseudintermedius HKU10-03]ADX76706.1 hypothetical protein SPSE_1446 [Staphylococcus pseudintermedius ED99]ANS89657.1 hypothetical protein A6M57_6705 [Staphylococcus pseudintermedius]